jgi:hypothetical protein
MFCHKCGTTLPDQSLFCPACGTAVNSARSLQTPQPAQDGAAGPGRKGRGRILARATVVVVGLFMLGALFRSGTPAPANTSSGPTAQASVAVSQNAQPVPTDTSSSAASEPEIPTEEKEFIRAVQDARTAFHQAANELAQGGTRSERKSAICRSLTGLSVSGWVGRIHKLGSNGDGKGVLEISLADDVRAETWNNDLSDISDNTLIDPTSSLFHTLSQMKEGDEVVFSGSFLPSDLDCVREPSVTLEGSMTDPEFVFRFARVEKH